MDLSENGRRDTGDPFEVDDQVSLVSRVRTETIENRTMLPRPAEHHRPVRIQSNRAPGITAGRG